MKEKKNLTQWGASELLDWVNNEESLYALYQRAIRYGDFNIIKEAIDEEYIYSQEQLDELRTDFNEEINED